MSEKTIGTLSKFTGIHAHTIKYYEKIGLLSSNRKEHSNYRSYDMRICTDIYECVKYRNMGFSLKETKELDYEGGDYLESDGLNLSALLPVSKTTVHMEKTYLNGGRKGYSWGMGIFPGKDRAWIEGRAGYRHVPAGRAFVFYLKITGPYVSDGSMAEEINGHYRRFRSGTPEEAFGVRLKITCDEEGNDWNYFKIFIPLEEK